MKAYDTPTLDVEWFTAQTALSQSPRTRIRKIPTQSSNRSIENTLDQMVEGVVFCSIPGLAVHDVLRFAV